MSPTRFKTLDHWRGVAALWVVFFHASSFWIFPADSYLSGVHDFFRLGWFGVHLFFVISGYCLAERAARSLAKNESTLSFLIDRAFRVFPTYWAALLLAITLAALATPFNHLPLLDSATAIGAIPTDPRRLADAVLLSAPWTGGEPYMLVSWTLTTELSFYLLVGLGIMLARLTRSDALVIITGVILAILQVTGFIVFPRAILIFWPEFICGMLTWQIVNSFPAQKLTWITAIVGIIVLGVLGFLNGGNFKTLPWAAGFALFLVLWKRFDQQVAGTRWLDIFGFLGVLSFSLYLIHVPLISPMQNLLHRIRPDAAHFAWIPFLLSSIAIAAAWGFYRLVENPIERWRHRRTKPVLTPSTL